MLFIILNDIGKSIDEVHSVQSQWVGPYSFSYKAEVDFDGTYIAARLLDRYQSEFKSTHEMGMCHSYFIVFSSRTH